MSIWLDLAAKLTAQRERAFSPECPANMVNIDMGVDDDHWSDYQDEQQTHLEFVALDYLKYNRAENHKYIRDAMDSLSSYQNDGLYALIQNDDMVEFGKRIHTLTVEYMVEQIRKGEL